MSGFNLPCLQFHFPESKGSGKATATLDVILLSEQLLGDMRANTCSDLCPVTNPTVSTEKPMNVKITQHGHKRSLHNKGDNTKNTCKNRARHAKTKAR